MMIETTYYQRNREVILNIAKIIIKITKKYEEKKQEINIEDYQKKKKRKYEIRKENMEEIETKICLKVNKN